MKLQLRNIQLIGGGREIEFSPGLNVIAGPIATGKTTFMRMCRALLGGPIEHVPPEARENVAALAGRILLTEREFAIVRPFVGTETAKVEIAGADNAWRLPAIRPDATSTVTYGHWLLDQLKLPLIRVPAARTRPAESAWTPITINDYMLYCFIPSETIDSSVFGHRDTFKNIKRRYVFDLMFGFYDADIAGLQEQLSTLQARVTYLRAAEVNFRQFAEGTRLENRAHVQEQLQAAESEFRRLEQEIASESTDIDTDSPTSSEARRLRDEIMRLDEQAQELLEQMDREENSRADMERLRAQLEVQSARLTKAIVTGELLVDLEFLRCPRCGAQVTADRTDPDHCILCLQEPARETVRQDLVNEQARIVDQIQETDQLAGAHRDRLKALETRLEGVKPRRQEHAGELEFITRTYVSENAEQIRGQAARRAELRKTIEQLRDDLALFAKLDRTDNEIGELEVTIEAINAQIDQKAAAREEASQYVNDLGERFLDIVERLGLPRFPGEPRAAIDRETYLPILNGRPFAQLSSSGLMLLTNVAFALAHHVTAIEQGLALPGLLLVDNITKNVGTEDYDWERVEAVFNLLVELSNELGDQFQVIVSSNDVPPQVSDYVRLHLDEDDRLIRPEGASRD